MTQYIVNSDFKIDAYYEEPIDDGCPSYGSYTKDIVYWFTKGEIITTDEKGYIEPIYDSPYGVSMHGSTVHFPKTLSSVPEEFYSEIKNINALKKYNELTSAIRTINEELNEYYDNDWLNSEGFEATKEIIRDTDRITQNDYEEHGAAMDRYVDRFVEYFRKINQAKRQLESFNNERAYYASRLTYSEPSNESI